MAKDKLENKKIGIIGFGHMGNSLMKGLLNSGFKRENIIISNKLENNRETVNKAEWIFIAVKPFDVQTALEEIKDIIKNKIIISIAAGININMLQNYIRNSSQKIIRLMPNIFISENSGCIGFYSNKFVNNNEESEIIKLLSHLGSVIKVKRENDLDSLTILIGCAPAIISYFIELLVHYANLKGLKDKSLDIILSTFSGTITYLKRKQISPITLIKSVSTKGGITEAIINNMEKNKIKEKFLNSMLIGCAKINEIETKLAKDSL